MSNLGVLTISEIKSGVRNLASKYHGIKSVMLIGSYVHDTAEGDSDIDLVIDLVNEFDSMSYLGFLEDAEQMFNREIDLLTTEGVRQSVLKDDLLHGGVYLYGES
ncbi:MAG: nucleotidyltransferase domain-containing protein [Paenibacillaceae bacterium]